jgi:hypothetical protein
MTGKEYIDGSGPFDVRYLAFLETITTLRPFATIPNVSSRLSQPY